MHNVRMSERKSQVEVKKRNLTSKQFTKSGKRGTFLVDFLIINGQLILLLRQFRHFSLVFRV